MTSGCISVLYYVYVRFELIEIAEVYAGAFLFGVSGVWVWFAMFGVVNRLDIRYSVIAFRPLG